MKNTSVADPDPGSGIGYLFDPWIRDPRWEKVSIRIRDEQPGSHFLELRNRFFAFFWVKILKFFDEDPGSGLETVRIRDPGWKIVGSGIRDKHPGSATLKNTKISVPYVCFFYTGQVQKSVSLIDLRLKSFIYISFCPSHNPLSNKFLGHPLILNIKDSESDHICSYQTG
jgi:hypothetical protein